MQDFDSSDPMVSTPANTPPPSSPTHVTSPSPNSPGHLSGPLSVADDWPSTVPQTPRKTAPAASRVSATPAPVQTAVQDDIQLAQPTPKLGYSRLLAGWMPRTPVPNPLFLGSQPIEDDDAKVRSPARVHTPRITLTPAPRVTQSFSPSRYRVAADQQPIERGRQMHRLPNVPTHRDDSDERISSNKSDVSMRSTRRFSADHLRSPTHTHSSESVMSWEETPNVIRRKAPFVFPKTATSPSALSSSDMIEWEETPNVVRRKAPFAFRKASFGEMSGRSSPLAGKSFGHRRFASLTMSAIDLDEEREDEPLHRKTARQLSTASSTLGLGDDAETHARRRRRGRPSFSASLLNMHEPLPLSRTAVLQGLPYVASTIHFITLPKQSGQPGNPMNNTRNTCWCISALMALYHTPWFFNALLAHRQTAQAEPACVGMISSPRECLLCLLATIGHYVFLEHTTAEAAVYVDTELLVEQELIGRFLTQSFQAGRFESVSQAVEELMKLCDQYWVYINPPQAGSPQRPSPFLASSCVELIYATICSVCGHTTFKRDNAHVLQVPAVTADASVVTALESRLSSKFSPQVVSDWTCSQCNVATTCIRKEYMGHLPASIFTEINNLGAHGTSPSNCSFGRTLDVGLWSAYHEECAQYALQAVITLHNEHFVTYLEHQGRWWRYDDHTRTPMHGRPEDIQHAYLLFWSKHNEVDRPSPVSSTRVDAVSPQYSLRAA